MASAGWRKNAGVPVLESVAAILRQTDTRLAHAGDDHTTTALVEQVDGQGEVLADAFDELENRVRLGLEYLARQREVGRHDLDRRHVGPGVEGGVNARQARQQGGQP